MKLEYEAKIILAWTEAVGGNAKIRDWLIKNGYPELGLFVFALHNQTEARDWLIQNGHPHLMALINGAEGKKNAQLWLKKYNFEILEKVARSGDNEQSAFDWLLKNNHRDFAMLSMRIREVKNTIEMDNIDVHKYNI